MRQLRVLQVGSNIASRAQAQGAMAAAHKWLWTDQPAAGSRTGSILDFLEWHVEEKVHDVIRLSGCAQMHQLLKQMYGNCLGITHIAGRNSR